MNCKYGMHDIFTHARKYDAFERTSEDTDESRPKLRASHSNIYLNNSDLQKNTLAINSSSNSQALNSSKFFKCKE